MEFEEGEFGLFPLYDDYNLLPWVKVFNDMVPESLPRLKVVLFKIAASFLFFVVVHFISTLLWMNTKVYKRIVWKERIFLSEKVCSTIHGLVCGTWALGLVLAGTFSENFHYYPRYSDYLFTFSMGYEIYDLITMAIQGQKQIEMYLHHLALIICYTLQLWYRLTTFVTTTMLVTELTVIPSNFHWYFKTLRMKESFIFRVNKAMRIISFLVLRLWAGPYVIFVLLIFQYDHFLEFGWFGKCVVTFFPGFLTALNWYWTYLMWKLFWAPPSDFEASTPNLQAKNNDNKTSTNNSSSTNNNKKVVKKD